MASRSTSRSFPGFSALFRFADSHGRAFHATFDRPLDPFAVTRGEFRPEEPLKLRWAMGHAQPSLVVRTTSAVPIIVHETVLSVLAPFTGWTTYDVLLFGKHHEPIAGYHGLAVTGRCGAIDDTLSVPFVKQYPARKSVELRGLYFDPASWDGSDLFIPGPVSGAIFVVDAVKAAFDRAKITNVRFERLDEVERPVYGTSLEGRQLMALDE